MSSQNYIQYACLYLLMCIAALGCGASDTKATAPSSADESANSAPILNESLNDIKSADDRSPYKEVLVGCVSIMNASDSCELKKLPLIGQDFETPSVDDIMTRVAVSHPWMANRFREVLTALPPDILTLLKAVTAIVIDADVRPSYYSTRTGAMYIDPGILWLTNDEKATISKKVDFRKNYGQTLQFVNVWRYVKDNARAYKIYAIDGSEERELKDILYLAAAVLYHESSHANDSFPALTRADVPRSASVYQASLDNSLSIARSLRTKFPLKDEFIYDIAQVLLLGLQPGKEQERISAEFVGAAFEKDGANDIYNYVSAETSLSVASLREDVAMLFEEVMMKYHFGIDRDVGFLQDNANGKYCNDFPLGWGARNRIADPNVIERAKFVASMVEPDVDFAPFFSTLATAQILPKNTGWCSLLSKSSEGGAAKAVGGYSAGDVEPLERELRPGL